MRARSLLSHGDSGYEEWGVSASVAYAPGSGGWGLTLRAGSSWGASTGGAERLWSQAAGLSPGGAFEPGGAGFEAEAAWGLDAPRGLLTPYTGVAVSGDAETWRAGAHPALPRVFRRWGFPTGREFRYSVGIIEKYV